MSLAKEQIRQIIAENNISNGKGQIIRYQLI